MVFTEESKAFVKILYLITSYGEFRVPWQRMKKVWMGRLTKLHKTGTSDGLSTSMVLD